MPKTLYTLISKTRAMDKKVVIGVIVIALLLTVSVWWLLRPKPIVWSDEPEDWVKKDGKVRHIDVLEATKAASRMDVNGQQYETETIGTVFETEGWYQGNNFKTEYVVDDKVLMRITPDMTPGDGVIEGFVMERIEDVPYILIFLDEDWKNTIPNTMIYWGKRRQMEALFDFTQEVSSGVYLNKVPDDPERFEGGTHWGGAWIGELKEDETSTIISFN